MKKYSHAWIAFKAIDRIKTSQFTDTNQRYADNLAQWFLDHRDGVVNGAWFPDTLIKRNNKDHIRKFTPANSGEGDFRVLPGTHRMYQDGRQSALHGVAYTVDKGTNLPNRCEALAHSVIDQLKIQEKELKGSPIAPVDNQVALLMFMLAHYVADAHMPFHCDARPFSQGVDLHAHIEGKWEDEIKRFYAVDESNERFFYDRHGFPERTDAANYQGSFLADLDQELGSRPFRVGYGQTNGNILEFMEAVCQYSYLISYEFIPQGFNEQNVTLQNYHNLPGQRYSYKDLSLIAFADAIDSLARAWFRVWRRYMRWAWGS